MHFNAALSKAPDCGSVQAPSVALLERAGAGLAPGARCGCSRAWLAPAWTLPSPAVVPVCLTAPRG